jgi:uncharacterized protein
MRIRIQRHLLSLCRTVHVYLTMLGLGVILFFGLTGFTVNHEDWFGATRPVVANSSGQTPVNLLAKGDGLRIVEHLRAAFHVTGAMTDFADEGASYSISFKDPGQLWEIEIEKASGKTRIHNEAYNLAAIVNNLHRGRYAGPAWSWIIDLSACCIALACATGLVLWLALPRRRMMGLAALLLGTLGVLLIYHFLIPGPDAAAPDAKSAQMLELRTATEATDERR